MFAPVPRPELDPLIFSVKNFFEKKIYEKEKSHKAVTHY